ncbi:MAG: lipoyl synthase, partial [Thermoplasmata archaeon]|nr:lipoyl synthase [Thermoplasmata archaeon]
KHGKPLPLNPDEPREVAESVKALGLRYAVITSVTRDDLPDGGATVFYETVKEIKKINKNCRVEVLIPDFRGDREALKRVIDAKPDVINHNIEVVKELFPKMRPQGDYNRSLYVLRIIKEMNNRIITKSGFMVGLGETNEQILKTMQDLKENGVDILTIGQYLQPTKNHAEVRKYYTPKEFTEFRDIAMDMGFKHVESAPLVRSSYHAEQALNNVLGL